MTIRARLVLLVLALLVPATALAVWGIVIQYQRERAAIERSVRETTRALARVIDREIGKRETIARLLADSPLLREPDLEGFWRQARRATEGTEGWVVLADRERQLVNTAFQWGAALSPRKEGEERRFAFTTDAAILTDVAIGRLLNVPVASIQVPVQREGLTVYNVGVTLRPSELRAVLEEQLMPSGWISTVLDRAGTIVSRVPDHDRWSARPARPQFVQATRTDPEGFVETDSLEGEPIVAFYSRSPVYGWTFVIGVPRAVLSQSIQRSLVELIGLGALLLAGGIALALALGRRIIGPIRALSEDALRLERGETVKSRATGVLECDEVSASLAAASERIRNARADLEREVRRAVATTASVQAQLGAAQRLEALGRLTGGVAHDFNNMLAIVNNNLYLQRLLAPQLAASPAHLAMQRAVDAGVRLTRQLLSFSRRQALSPKRIDLKETLPNLHDLIATSVGASIALELRVDPDIDAIEADASELELALLNLAINAKDAMPEGGKLTIEARNAKPDEAPDAARRFVVVAASDTGRGIDTALLDRVFEPFFTTKPAGQGTGLGLSQVYGFCQRAGGTARIASTRERGTTVTLLLPSQEAPSDAPVDPDVASTGAQGTRVLLVEDNADLREATSPVLGALGFSVTAAGDADEALGVLDRGAAVDVVLSDVMMPGTMNGLGLARLLRGRRPQTPVVLMTGYTDQYERAVEEGFRVLHKPSAPEALAAALHAALAGATPTR